MADLEKSGRLLDLRGLPRRCWWYSTPLPVQEMQETQVQFLGQEDLLKEDMTTHSSILA